MDKRGRKPQFFLHPARESSSRTISKITQASKVQQLSRALLEFILRDIEDFTEEFDVFLNAQIAIQPKTLREISDLFARLFHLRRNFITSHTDHSTCRFKRAHH